MRAAVVGAGVMGLATARELARRGHDVDVYEQFELGHARGSSHGTSRIFRLSYPQPRWIRLAQRAYELWRELERDAGVRLLELHGLVDVDSDPSGRLDALAECGVAYEVMSGAQAQARFGFAYEEVERVVFTSDAGIARADEVLEAFAREAERHGARIHTGTHVENLEDVDVDVVVVTAGGWAPKLLAAAGVDLRAQPTRESVAYYALGGDQVFPSLIDELEGEQFYALAAPGVGVKVGLHHGGRVTDPDEDVGPDAAALERIDQWVARRLPRVDPKRLHAQSCIYTNTPDLNFVCERRGRVVVGSACSGHGFKFAPAVGEQMANLAEL